MELDTEEESLADYLISLFVVDWGSKLERPPAKFAVAMMLEEAQFVEIVFAAVVLAAAVVVSSTESALTVACFLLKACMP